MFLTAYALAPLVGVTVAALWSLAAGRDPWPVLAGAVLGAAVAVVTSGIAFLVLLGLGDTDVGRTSRAREGAAIAAYVGPAILSVSTVLGVGAWLSPALAPPVVLIVSAVGVAAAVDYIRGIVVDRRAEQRVQDRASCVDELLELWRNARILDAKRTDGRVATELEARGWRPDLRSGKAGDAFFAALKILERDAAVDPAILATLRLVTYRSGAYWLGPGRQDGLNRFTMAIDLDTDDALARAIRGALRAQSGALAGAADDLAQAFELASDARIRALIDTARARFHVSGG